MYIWIQKIFRSKYWIVHLSVKKGFCFESLLQEQIECISQEKNNLNLSFKNRYVSTLSYFDIFLYLCAGVEASRQAAFVLVARGLGERLCYSDIETKLPTDFVREATFLQVLIFCCNLLRSLFDCL